MVKLLYFMHLVDTIGCACEEVILPDAVADVNGLVAWLERRGEHYRTALAGGASLQITINKHFVDLAAAVKDGDEIAFFPRAK